MLANFCKLRIRRNLSMALSFRRKGRCEFSARLFLWWTATRKVVQNLKLVWLRLTSSPSLGQPAGGFYGLSGHGKLDDFW